MNIVGSKQKTISQLVEERYTGVFINGQNYYTLVDEVPIEYVSCFDLNRHVLRNLDPNTLVLVVTAQIVVKGMV